MTPVRLCTSMEFNCTSHFPIGTVGRSLADQSSDESICSDQGCDLIVGAIRHHFRSYLEAEPEVQAEVAVFQTTRTPKGTCLEFTSHINNILREMESDFKGYLPPKMKGFIIKRQAKLTPDQAKQLHFYMPTRNSIRIEWRILCIVSTKLTRLWGRFLVTEQNWSKVPIEHTRIQIMQKQSSNSAVTEQVEPIHYPSHATESESEIDLDWDFESVDDHGYPLVDENGSSFVPVPKNTPLDETEASSLSAWAQGYREARA